MPNPASNTLVPRVLLAIYWPMLAISTHWPNLQIPDAVPLFTDADKALHAAAFGLLTLLLTFALRGSDRPQRWAIIATFVAAVYAGLDEYTQRYFERVVSPADAAANLFGVATVSLAYWAHLKHRDRPTRWVRPARVVLALVIPVCVIAAFIPLHFVYDTVGRSATFRQLVYSDFDKHIHLLGAMALAWIVPAARLFGTERPMWNTLGTIAALTLAGPALEAAQGVVGRHLDPRDLAFHEYGLVIGLATWLAFTYTRDTLLVPNGTYEPAPLRSNANAP